MRYYLKIFKKDLNAKAWNRVVAVLVKYCFKNPIIVKLLS